MSFNPAKVSLMAFAVLFKILSAYCVCGGTLEILPFFDSLLVFLGIKPGTLGSKDERVNSSATRTEKALAKNF